RGQRTVVRGLLIVAHASILVKTPPNGAPSQRPSVSLGGEGGGALPRDVRRRSPGPGSQGRRRRRRRVLCRAELRGSARSRARAASAPARAVSSGVGGSVSSPAGS